MNNLPLVEIFSSIQGEGPFVGLRQIFIRFFGCDVHCRYCDTPHDVVPPSCAVRTMSGPAARIVNPVSLDDVLTTIRGYTDDFPRLHHSVSITGGEPLMHAETLREWLPEIRKILPVYLETAGLHVDALRVLGCCVDFVSMDMKLPSVTGLAPQWDRHREFLEVAQPLNPYVKVVVGAESPLAEIEAAAAVVAACDEQIPFVIQPVTTAGGKVGVPAELLLRFQEAASVCLPHVRVIPQVHRFLDVI